MIHVACAVIERDGLVLAAKRSFTGSMPDKWEFPGGKLEKGESPEDCLRREIREELGVNIMILKKLTPVMHAYPDFDITMYPFLCCITRKNSDIQTECADSGEPRLLGSHSEIRWDTPENLKTLNWAAADIPVLKEISV